MNQPKPVRTLRSSRRQRGLSLIGLVAVLVLIAVGFILCAKVLPTFVEYRAIQSAVKKAQDSSSSVPEIQKAFDRSAAIDDITTLTGKDLDIVKVDNDFVVSYAYTKKVPLYGPVSLSIDYAGSSKSR